MSKPKFQWQERQDGTNCIRGTYDHVVVVVYEERKAAKGVKGKYRIRCLKPKYAKLSKPVVFTTEADALRAAENEARRIYQNKPVVDHDAIYQLTQKAKERDDLLGIIAQTGRGLMDAAKEFVLMIQILAEIHFEPLQAAYEVVKLRKLTGGRDPAELIGKYLDEHERVRNHMLIRDVVDRRIAQIRKEKLGEKEKIRRISIINEFADERPGRLIETVTVEELKNWYLGLQMSGKSKYDKWLILRDLIEVAYKDYEAITSWVYERVTELNYCERSKTLHVLLPLALWQELFNRCRCANDALYLAIMSDVPIRDAEVKRLQWELIVWHGPVPRYFHVPPEVAQKNGTDRYVRIPYRLRRILTAFRRETGPIIVGTGHLERLKAIAKEIDPAFKWPKNALRRTCISNHVAVFNNRETLAKQCDHTVAEMKRRYERPVNPIEARKYVAHQPDFDRLKALPYEPSALSGGRPPKVNGNGKSDHATESEVLSRTPLPPDPDNQANGHFLLIPTADAPADNSGVATSPTEPTADKSSPRSAPLVLLAPPPSSANASNENPSTRVESAHGKASAETEMPGMENPPMANDAGIESARQQDRKKRPLKFIGTESIPAPPRREDGTIVWKEAQGQLAVLAEKFPLAQVAAAWNIKPSTIYRRKNLLGIKVGVGKWVKEAAEQRRRLLAATQLPAPPKKEMPWDKPAKFLHMLWETGAPKIAELYDCDQTILYDHADALDLPHPKRGYWRRKQRVIPPDVLDLMAKLDAEAATLQADTGCPATTSADKNGLVPQVNEGGASASAPGKKGSTPTKPQN